MNTRTLALISSLLAACAHGAPAEDTMPIAAPDPGSGFAQYEGTYTLEWGARTTDLRVYVEEGHLKAQYGGQTTQLRPQRRHMFLHGTRDDIRLVFTLENGRAERIAMHQGDRKATGNRIP